MHPENPFKALACLRKLFALPQLLRELFFTDAHTTYE